MSSQRLGGDSFYRVAVAVLTVADLLAMALAIGESRVQAAAEGVVVGPLLGALSSDPVRFVIALAGGIAVLRFARAAGRWNAGLWALASLTLMSTVHAQLFGSPWRHLYYSGIGLGGWLLGDFVASRQGRPDVGSYSRMGATALLAAAYFNAGISKLVYGGLDWLSGATIQTIVIGQDGLVSDSLFSVYRAWVASHGDVAACFAVATVAFELAAPAMLINRHTRLVIAGGLILMHVNIYVLTDILYWESVYLLALFGLSRFPEAHESNTADSAEFGGGGRRFTAAVVALLAVCAVAICHQGYRYDRFVGGHQALAPVPVGASRP